MRGNRKDSNDTEERGQTMTTKGEERGTRKRREEI